MSEMLCTIASRSFFCRDSSRYSSSKLTSKWSSMARLAAAGHDDDVLDAGMQRLLHAVLDDRLVDDRQHLLRLRLGGGQEPGAEPGGGKDSFSNFGGHLLQFAAPLPHFATRELFFQAGCAMYM